MKSKFLLRFVSICFAVLAMATNCQANLVTNGSFENPGGSGLVVTPGLTYAPGWTQLNSTGIYGDSAFLLPQDGSFTYHPGHQWGPGSVQTSFATQVGSVYDLSFYANGFFVGLTNQTGTVVVGDLNDSFNTVQATSSVIPNWTLLHFQFTATSTTSTLTFTNNSNGTTGPTGNAITIDNVVVTLAAVPEPTTFAMFGLAMACLSRRRRT